MAKNIVLCSDGTGNSAGKFRGTNVKRIYDAIDRTLPEPRQVAFYDDGVGTETSRLRRTLGGALGFGLSRNIREMYTFLAQNYLPGDRIFLFGFSRGAHTVRAAAGMIARVGVVATRQSDIDGGADGPLPQREFERRIRLAYRVYRGSAKPSVAGRVWRWLRGGEHSEPDAAGFRAAYAVRHPGQADAGLARIAFVGIWDTVDAVGAPVPELADLIDVLLWRFRFRNFDLSPQVDKGCHALAIDDARHTFHPVLWNEMDEPEPEPGAAPRIEQVWFPGMHSNVGGGYARDELALVPLLWMIGKAEAAGLRLRLGLHADFVAAADRKGPMHNARAGLATFYRYKPRYLDVLANLDGRHDRVTVAGVAAPKVRLKAVVLHESVLARARGDGVPYAPVALPVDGRYLGEDRSAEALRALQPKELGEAMQGVRDLCWWRQVHYYALLLLTIAAALVGFWPEWFGIDTRTAEWPWLEWLIGAVEPLIPAVLDPLVTTYTRRLTILAIVLGAALALFLFNWWVRRRVEQESDYAWRQSFGLAEGEAPPEPTVLHEIARAIRLSPFARGWDWFAKRWWPWIASIGPLLALGVWGIASLV
jgi:uncharacterized protein (DUF2235 family)